MKILTEPVGSVPRPAYLLEGMQANAQQLIDTTALNQLFDKALKETIKKLKKQALLLSPMVNKQNPALLLTPSVDCKVLRLMAWLFLLQMGTPGNCQKLPKGRFTIKLMQAVIGKSKTTHFAAGKTSSDCSFCYQFVISARRD